MKKKLVGDLEGAHLEALAKESLNFLEKVYSGEVESNRHNQYFSKSAGESQKLLYTGISDPFLEEQTDLGSMKYLIYSHSSNNM